MPATCVPQYVPRANTGLSKHGDPVFPHFWSWNQNLAHVCAKGGGAFNCLPPPPPRSCPLRHGLTNGIKANAAKEPNELDRAMPVYGSRNLSTSDLCPRICKS